MKILPESTIYLFVIIYSAIFLLSILIGVMVILWNDLRYGFIFTEKRGRKALIIYMVTLIFCGAGFYFLSFKILENLNLITYALSAGLCIALPLSVILTLTSSLRDEKRNF